MKNFLLLLILLILISVNTSSGENISQDKNLFPFQDIDFGYMDKNGKTVIKTQFFYGWNFSEGLARVMMNNGEMGFIDVNGRFVIEPQFKDTWSFSEGLAVVKRDDNIGLYINKKGNSVKDPSGEVIEELCESGYFSRTFVPNSLVYSEELGYTEINNKIVSIYPDRKVKTLRFARK